MEIFKERCPNCGSHRIHFIGLAFDPGPWDHWKCDACHGEFPDLSLEVLLRYDAQREKARRREGARTQPRDSSTGQFI